MSSGPITSWQINGETVETVTDFIFLGSKITADVTAAMKLKNACSLEERHGKHRQCIKKQRHYFACKVLFSQSYVVAFSSREGNGNPFQYSCLEKRSHGRRSLVGCSPWGLEESDRPEWLHFHFSCMREGNGNSLQCSYLENPRDGRAWRAAIYGVAQSRTRLKRLSSSSSSSNFFQ